MKKICLSEEKLSDWDFDKIKNIKADVFIYSYEYGCYEGSGFAAWRRNNKWYYSSLGHCSCNGPTDFADQSDNSPVSKTDLLKIANKVNWDKNAQAVGDYIKKYYS